MSKFTDEFIENELDMAERDRNSTINNIAYHLSALVNYPDALKEIQRLREALTEINNLCFQRLPLDKRWGTTLTIVEEALDDKKNRR